MTGNVTTGFAVKAEGDIIVNGVVEGATLVSGGNIVLKRGMQGMDRGMLQAEGNITAKFLENCKVRCKGMLKADAILHSDVECQENVDILGKKGLINGGSLSTYADVHATTLGSTMGASTKIKIISDKELIIRANEIKEEVENKEETIRKIDEVVNRVKGQLASNQEVLPEQMNYLKQATVNKPLLVKQIRELREEREKLLVRIEKNKHSCIRVEGAVYSGIDITIKDVSKIQHEQVSHCRFVRDGAVTMAPRTLNAADAQGRELNQNQHIYDQNGIQFQQEVRREGRQTVETQESEAKDYDKKGNGKGTGAKNSSKKKQKQEKKERLAPRSTGSFDITI